MVLSWSGQSAATNYQVWWRVTNGTWENRTVTGTNTTINGLTSGTQHEFTVRANCSGSFTAFTSPFGTFATQTAPVCATPTNLNTTNITSNSARVTWEQQTGAANYQVWWRVTGGTWGNQTVTTNSLTINNLQSSTAYEFTVRASCSGNFTTYANPYGNFTTRQEDQGNACDGIPNFRENNGYVAGSRVQNAGAQYECKPFPFSGWCNGAAWAYAPGTGIHWRDAWTLNGSCAGGELEEGMVQEGNSVVIMPNPFVNHTTIFLENGMDITAIRIVDASGREILNKTLAATDKFDFNEDTDNLASGVYIVYVFSNDKVFNGKLIKQK